MLWWVVIKPLDRARSRPRGLSSELRLDPPFPKAARPLTSESLSHASYTPQPIRSIACPPQFIFAGCNCSAGDIPLVCAERGGGRAVGSAREETRLGHAQTERTRTPFHSTATAAYGDKEAELRLRRSRGSYYLLWPWLRENSI
ncbi:hypothetical protein G7K_1716-t1 [Saitoella complicata NRRL Y-17804]|uniref:Uncharacterized protein n=1 Tax=Saitoella complicata (strain BCRC 22490 / CBS 7301 / JCM 7358 / NBRC 10748 / NRRL Y-17804) TaxID=698492 RepID=A0A0E9NCT6_SAICN|nr:hypothetical protein G7K_1716-t1 [Saitoella complicata NRRL Y-17804]